MDDARRWELVAAAIEAVADLDPSERAAHLEARAAEHPEIAADLGRVAAALDGADGFASGLSRELGELLVPQALRHGEVLGAYTIDRPLGWGGMGAVYLAHRSDDQFEKTVAVKMLPASLASESERRQIDEERRILARLEHPSIARLIDGGVSDDGQPYFVLEYVEGEPADDFADAADLDAVLDAFIDICEAVAHAHAELIIHCDLKPGNVLVTEDGGVKLLDFGIARLLGAQESDSDLGETPITRNYAAPELLAGGPVDTRADVYSLGILFYRLLAGEQPYRLPPAPAAELRAHLAEARVPPLERAGKLAAAPRLRVAELSAVIARATAAEPGARTSGARALADEVRRIRGDLPLAEAPAGARAYRLRKAARRNPVAVALSLLAALFAAGAVAALATALVVTRAEKRRTDEANARLERERHTASEVSDFLVTIFDAADPELRRADAGRTTARELLDSGLARIDRPAVGDPAVAARLALTMGRIARKIGEYDSAKKVLARAAGAADPEVARRALFELGAAQGRSGEEEAGLRNLTEAARRCRAAGDDMCLLEALVNRGELEFDKRDVDAARVSLTEALERAASMLPTRRVRSLVAWATYGLAVSEHRGGGNAAAAKQFDRAEALFATLEDEPTIEAGRSYMTLAIARSHRGDNRSAVELFERARSIFVKLYGPRHIRVAYLDFMAAIAYAEIGKLDEARRAAETAVAIRREVLGEDHGDTGMAWGRLADILSRSGDDAAAMRAATTSRSITRTRNRTSYANVGRLLATLQIRSGDAAAALATARESLAIYEAGFGADHPMTLRGHASVAAALAAGGDLAGAIASQERALAIGDATLQKGHPRRVGLLVDLGDFRRRAGQAGAARQALEEALELAEAAEPPQQANARRARELLAKIP